MTTGLADQCSVQVRGHMPSITNAGTLRIEPIRSPEGLLTEMEGPLLVAASQVFNSYHDPTLGSRDGARPTCV